MPMAKKMRDLLGGRLEERQKSRIEWLDSRKMNIEGCQGVLCYGDDSIRLNLGQRSFVVTGADEGMS